MACTNCDGSDVVITGASGIGVAGSGTPTDPYVVSQLASASSAPNFQVRTSSTVALTLYGSGTTYDPYVLRADTGSAAQLKSLSDVSSIPAVSQGAVPMWIGPTNSGAFQFNYPGTRYTTSTARGSGRYQGEVARDTDTGNRWEWDGGQWVTLNPAQPTFTLDPSVLQNAGTIDSTVDWNTLTARSGIYRVSSGVTTTNNSPTGATGNGTLEVVISGTSVTQRYSAHVTGIEYTRTKWNAADWTAWYSPSTGVTDGTSGIVYKYTATNRSGTWTRLTKSGGMATLNLGINVGTAGLDQANQVLTIPAGFGTANGSSFETIMSTWDNNFQNGGAVHMYLQGTTWFFGRYWPSGGAAATHLPSNFFVHGNMTWPVGY